MLRLARRPCDQPAVRFVGVGLRGPRPEQVRVAHAQQLRQRLRAAHFVQEASVGVDREADEVEELLEATGLLLRRQGLVAALLDEFLDVGADVAQGRPEAREA